MFKPKILRILGFIFLLLSCTKQEILVFEKQNFNENWLFKIIENSKKDNFTFQENETDSNWQLVQLPHTPKIEPKIVNNQWQGISCYKKEFNLSKQLKNKKLFFKFEGAMNIAEVWINEKKLMERHGGYLPFVIDFTEVALFDSKNTIVVKLNNKDNPITGPKPLEKLDFSTYGGIYRNVWLIAKNKLL